MVSSMVRGAPAGASRWAGQVPGEGYNPLTGDMPMLTSHVDALQTKHAGLDARLRSELARPAPDAAMVRDIKKQKLRIKEEIARL